MNQVSVFHGVRVWFRISVRLSAGGQFNAGAIFLEPFSMSPYKKYAVDISRP